MMNRYCRLTLVAMVSLMLISARSFAQATKPTEHPNIVFMLIDDMGWGEMGCYGNTFNETPRIDKFATTAMRFTASVLPADVLADSGVVDDGAISASHGD